MTEVPTPDMSTQRFVQSLHQALVANKLSQRELCTRLGITIGTLTKYLRGSVDPRNVGVSKIRKLAESLGVTTNTLLDYYETGEYRSSLTIDDVASWIRSSAGQADLPALLEAMKYGTMRELSVVPGSLDVAAITPQPVWAGYTDQEAEDFCSYSHDCLKLLSTETGKSLRGAWKIVESELEALGDLTEDEMDLCYDICNGSRVLSGAELTAAREQFLGRYESPCPITTAMEKIDELKGCEPLNSILRICSEAGGPVNNEPVAA
ncbi:MAG: hypothetical protein CL981_00425 [Euryarchaeota archaeon]|nr:hypothetical protein [Euryarchaeota archaeon]|tara:strand:+ start:335 stop:1126 length:792 start_codon:yes stop_codon:yes gene_type:complete